jgi:hypothetical protein
MLTMQRQQKYEMMGIGVAQAVMGAYLGSILFFITAGLIEKTDMLWTGESLRDLFLYSLAGVAILSWWIVPAGAFVGFYFCPRLSQWRRKSAVLRGIPLGAALGLFTAVFFTLISRNNTPISTMRLSFTFLPVYCALWCGGYSWLNANRG